MARSPKDDLPDMESGIFFTEGLDTPFDELRPDLPVGQISVRDPPLRRVVKPVRRNNRLPEMLGFRIREGPSERERTMMYRLAAAAIAGLIAAGAHAQQTTSGAKPETSCTTTGAATSGRGEEKTANSLAAEKSAVLPDAGGANSAAPTVQSGNKPMEVRKDCPPDSKAK
jgi:hypothetical protein